MDAPSTKHPKTPASPPTAKPDPTKPPQNAPVAPHEQAAPVSQSVLLLRLFLFLIVAPVLLILLLSWLLRF